MWSSSHAYDRKQHMYAAPAMRLGLVNQKYEVEGITG